MQLLPLWATFKSAFYSLPKGEKTQIFERKEKINVNKQNSNEQYWCKESGLKQKNAQV